MEEPVETTAITISLILEGKIPMRKKESIALNMLQYMAGYGGKGSRKLIFGKPHSSMGVGYEIVMYGELEDEG